MNIIQTGRGACSPAGYFSTTARLKDKPTELQASLAKVPTLESLAILEKLSYNIAVQPKEAKYRRLKLSNAKIAGSVVGVDGARDFLLGVGWEFQEDAQDGDVLVLPAAKGITMATVRDVQEAQRALTLKQKDLKRSASAASLPSNAGDPKAVLREQLENDRRERAALGPVTKGSTAQALPSGGITSAADLGINGGGCDC